jgi:hypothetical protein
LEEKQMRWIVGLGLCFAYAAFASALYVILNTMIGVRNSKATGWAVVRYEGYPLMVIGAFTVILGFVLTRLDMVADGAGRAHFVLR